MVRSGEDLAERNVPTASRHLLTEIGSSVSPHAKLIVRMRHAAIKHPEERHCGDEPYSDLSDRTPRDATRL
jgi:hypothetical protein